MARRKHVDEEEVVVEEEVGGVEGEPEVEAVAKPGDPPADDADRNLWVVGKGGLTARGKVWVEGETIALSDEEAEMVLDQGNQITHSDPVEGKKHAETRAERQAVKAKRAADRHAAAQEEAKEL